jgi:hypothetical protein
MPHSQGLWRTASRLIAFGKTARTMKKLSTTLLGVLLLLSLSAQRQTTLSTPDVSQAAMVMQRIGLTDMTVSYHSPLVGGRKIWGELVPYNKVWRAGANENTTVQFSTDVTVEGQKLQAGTYGLHMIPTESEWTIIFSKDYQSWGSFFYNEKNDALRVKVKPQTADHQEWLSYAFNDPKDNSVKLALRWEKLQVPVNITVDVASTVADHMRTELKGLAGFDPDAFYNAAAYCYRNNTNETEADQWLDKAIRNKPTFANMHLKATRLEAKGNKTEADALNKKAMAMADENGLNLYGYELLGKKNSTEAINIFKENVKRHPDSWNTYDSLGEAQAAAGDSKSAISNYKTALAKAPADQHERINMILKKLEEK